MSEIRVLSIKELPVGAKKVIQAGGRKILMINDTGILSAVQQDCPHAGAIGRELSAQDASCSSHTLKQSACRNKPTYFEREPCLGTIKI